MLSESQLAMLRKEALVAIGCNISSPRLIDVALLGCACCAQGHVGTHKSVTGERAGRFQTTENCAWSASTAVQLALCTGERRDRATLAWKVVGQIKERDVLPEVTHWHGKGSC